MSSYVGSTYASFAAFLGKKDSRTIQGKRATRVERRSDGIVVTYHGTVMVGAYPDGTFRIFGGIGSATDNVRINTYSPARVSQRDYRRYIATGERDERGRAVTIPFRSGMTIAADGTPVLA